MLKVKICGITNAEDAELACELGADALGFIFYPESPRYISPVLAVEVIRKLPAFVQKIGVFVNDEVENVQTTFNKVGLSYVQIHGDETPDYCTALSVPFIKAFRVDTNFNAEVIPQFRCNTFLLDAFSKRAYGGTGETFNWDLAVQAKRHGHLILAGGLNPENVLEAVKKVEPYAIDVSSGVEASPGKKDPDKMKRLFGKINQYRFKTQIENDKI